MILSRGTEDKGKPMQTTAGHVFAQCIAMIYRKGR